MSSTYSSVVERLVAWQADERGVLFGFGCKEKRQRTWRDCIEVYQCTRYVSRNSEDVCSFWR